jgi:hypothetical protein
LNDGVIMLSLVHMTLFIASPGLSSPASPIACANRAQDGQVYVELWLPQPISQRELDWFQAILQLDESQTEKAQSAYRDYLDKFDEVRSKSASALKERSAAIASTDYRSEPSQAASYEKLLTDGKRHAEKCEALEAQFFAAIHSVLRDDQLLALHRAQMARERIRANAVPNSFPGANFDLSYQLYEQARTSPFEPADPLAYESLLLDYETRYTHLVKDYSEAMKKARRSEIAILLAGQQQPQHSPELYAEFAAMASKIASRAKELHDVNRLFAERLATVMPPDASRMFLESFRRSAYSNVYPDPFSIEHLKEPLCAAVGEDAKRRDGISAIFDEYAETTEALSVEMVEQTLAIEEQFARTRVFDAARFDDYRAAMDVLQAKRRDAASQTLESITIVLTPGELAQVKSLIDRHNEEIQLHRSEQRGIYYKP